jgi:hypothetical protein
MKRDAVTRRWLKDFEGRLNLTSLHVSRLYAECNVENTGFLQKFLNRQDVKVDLTKNTSQGGQSISVPTPLNITLKGQVLRKVSLTKSIFEPQSVGDTLSASMTGPIGTGVYYLLPNDNEMLSDELSLRITDIPAQIDVTDPSDNLIYYMKVSEAGTYLMNVDFYCLLQFGNPFTDTASGKLEVVIKTGQGGTYTTQVGAAYNFTTVTNLTFFDSSSLGSGLPPYIHGYSIDLKAGDQIYIYGKLTITSGFSGALVFKSFYGDSTKWFSASISIQGDTITKDSPADVYLIHELANQVLSSICDKDNVLKSNFYGRPALGYASYGDGSKRAITNGYKIRGNNSKPVSNAFKDLFAALKAIDNIGIGYEQDSIGNEFIRIEPMDYFYQKNEILRLDNVLDINRTLASEDFFNLIEVGYAKYDFNKLSHLDEFNTKRQFTLPITQISRTLSYLSPFIASGYTIELVRRDRDLNLSRDNQADNDLYIIQLTGTEGSFSIDLNTDFTIATGVISPTTIYNKKLSPARMLRNHGNEIRSITEKMKDTGMLKFSYSEGNSGMSTQLSTETSPVVENADVAIKDLNKPQFLSDIYSFKAKLTRQQLLDLFANPYGYISFSHTTTDHMQMYILDATRNSNDNSLNFKGIAANI